MVPLQVSQSGRTQASHPATDTTRPRHVPAPLTSTSTTRSPASGPGAVHEEARGRPHTIELVEVRKVRPQHDLALIEVELLPEHQPNPYPRSWPPNRIESSPVGSGRDGLPSRAADEDYCYLTTTGRVSGEPREIEIWFGLAGDTLYMLSGGRIAPTGSGTCSISRGDGADRRRHRAGAGPRGGGAR